MKYINKNDIINTIYTTYIQNNYKNIDRVLFIDTINEKITDYISQMGKLLLNNWEEYNTIPLIQIGNAE